MPTSEWKSQTGRRVRPRDLHVLATVVRAGSIAQAAGRLGISEWSVSEAITNLEGVLCARMLEHTPQGVEPTAYASALLREEQVVHDELMQGAQEGGLPAGRLRIGCSETLASGFVPAVIERMSRDYPDLMFHVEPVEPARFRALRDRNIDLLVARILHLPLDSDLEAQVLFDDHYLVVAGPHNPWLRRRKIRFEELMNEPWIQNPSDTPLYEYVADALRRQGLGLPKATVVSQSLHVRNHLLASGGLLTLLWSSMLHFAPSASAIKPLAVDLRIPPRPVAAVTLKHQPLSPVAALFIKQARELAQAMQLSRHRGPGT